MKENISTFSLFNARLPSAVQLFITFDSLKAFNAIQGATFINIYVIKCFLLVFYRDCFN